MASQLTKRKMGQRKAQGEPDEEPQVMSGQTEEERRRLRLEQRQLLHRIEERATELTSLASKAFEEERSRNNKLFKKVRYTRELGNDGENMAAISELATKRSAQLARSVSRYSAHRVADCLQRDYGSHSDGIWLSLGRDVSALFRTVPRLDFMCGALQKPDKVKKPIQRKHRVAADMDDVEETQYETVDYSERQDAAAKKHEEATNQRLQHLLGELDKLGARQSPIDIMRLCVNPHSFHQTVENFFDLSFLVKDSKAGINLHTDSGLPTAALTQTPDQITEKHQTIVVLSPGDVADIADAWNITEPTLTRSYSERATS